MCVSQMKNIIVDYTYYIVFSTFFNSLFLSYSISKRWHRYKCLPDDLPHLLVSRKQVSLYGLDCSLHLHHLHLLREQMVAPANDDSRQIEAAGAALARPAQPHQPSFLDKLLSITFTYRLYAHDANASFMSYQRRNATNYNICKAI